MFQQMRKISPTRRSVSGHYSFRGNESIPYESSLERDFIMLQEFNTSVKRIIPQPIEIPFHLGNRKYKYTPDFLVLFQNSNYEGMLVEVKPEAEWRQHWRKWLAKWKAAYRWAQNHNFLFHIYDENRIRGQVLQNIKMLASFKRTTFNSHHVETVQQFLAQNTNKISDCLALFPHDEENERYRLIYAMLANGILITDINQPITSDSFIWAAENEK